MRNLKLDTINIKKLPAELINITRYIEINENIFILNNDCVHCLNDDNNTILNQKIMTVDWIPIENILYMGSGDGFQCYNVQTGDITEIEIPGGYLIHEWNPTQDRVAIVDKNGMLKIALFDAYNGRYNIIGEYCLENLEASPFINIGWGSKATQFHGSEGKYARTIIKDNEGTPTKNQTINIAWRDAGDIFAVSFVRDGQRIFKIFSCECDFLYESENKSGLSPVIAWKPDGTLLATECQTSSTNSIMFFEKNGLYRHELKLSNKDNVRKLQWNPAGDILMIWQQSINELGKEKDTISLWICSNFKWYLKQNLIFTADKSVNNVEWNGKKWLKIITSKEVILYSWKWVIYGSNNSMNMIDSKNFGTIAVIDGKILRMTLTKNHIIPPPLSSYEIEFENPINFVAFGSKGNNLIAVLDDNIIKFLEISNTSYMEKFSYKIESDLLPLAFNNFVFEDKNCNVFCLESGIDSSFINKFEFDNTNNTFSCYKYYESFENMMEMFQVFGPTNTELYLAICENSQIMIFRENVELRTLTPDFELIKDIVDDGGINDIHYLNGTFHTFTLNNRNFYYNGKKVTNNITSYLFCHGYLLITTETQLMCIKLSDKGLNKLNSSNLTIVYTRAIPNGAKLITAVPGTRNIILQVPRGELETINPRVLSIDDIDRLLAEKNHFEAYNIMRTDRINPNLLYDINPKRFLQDIEDFIKNIKNCEYLDVFLINLQDFNATEKLYFTCFEDPLPNVQNDRKLFSVTSRFIEAMKKIDIDYYLQSVVTAYIVRDTDEDYEKALEEILKAKKREENGVKLRMSVDNTLEHMILLSSVEKLYDIALGMDKLDLIMWVASKSQLDPLQYIPFLHELVAMEDNYRNYKINCHIKRFEKAFQFLIKCDNVAEELKQFVEKNNLHNLILKYVQYNNKWYNLLLKLYSHYLQKQGRYKQAGLMFMKINEYDLALENLIKSCCMNEALITLNHLNYNVQKKNSELEVLATKLIDNQKYIEASSIYENELKNYEEAIATLIKGKMWSNSHYLALKYNRPDIIESDLKVALSQYANNLQETIKALKEEFINLETRLHTLRNEKINQLRNGQSTLLDYEEQIQDCAARDIDLDSVVSTNYSTTTSQRTRSSNRSSASSRRQKRIDRKILQIREGSAFENIAIIRQLHLLIVRINNMSETVSDTCTHLFTLTEHFDKVNFLQTSYTQLLDYVMSSVDKIWPAEMLTPNPDIIESQVYRHNIEYLDIQYRFPPQNLRKNEAVF